MALIDNSQEIKKHSSAVESSIEVINVQSFIDAAINTVIIPAVGRSLFDQVVAAKESLSAKQTVVFDLLQKSCVGFLIADYSVSGAVRINNSGISVPKNDKSMPASDKKLLALRRESLELGYAALEQVVDYLEENLADFGLYAASDAHKENRKLFLNNSAEFQKAGINIGWSARLYKTLRTYQDGVERDHLNRLLGKELTSALRAAILTGTASDKQKELIAEVSRPVASFTMMKAINFLAVSITADGIFQLSESVGGMAANVETKTSASEARLRAMSYSLMAEGDKQLANLSDWLKENSSDFPEYQVPESVTINSDPNSNMYFL